jgi:flagellar hook-associated protein 2
VAISSPGIGSNLDINGIIAKLMQAEAVPLQALAKKEASYQAKLSAFGNLSGAISSFQTALAGLNNQATFKAMNAASSDSSLFTASATSAASAGNYSINVTKLAQAQTLSAAGRASTTAAIGVGTTTKLTFQFGTLDGASLAKAGTTLGAGIVSGGIPAGSLSINGTAIATDASTTSAKALAAAINLQTGTTGVTATAAPTTTAVLNSFTAVNTGASGSYTLNVGGVVIANVTAPSTTFTAADLDSAIATAGAGSVGAQLSAAGITVRGTAAAGTLQFVKADGSNIDITQTLTGSAAGGFTALTNGVTQTTTASVSLSSSTTLTIGGSDPAAAGFMAGSGVPSFTPSANEPSGSVTIDNTSNSLQGIRDAINKANLGVTASIVSDGSATPYRLVIKSNKTGAESSMKISVQAGGDPAVASLLRYDHDPAAAPTTLTETAAAQSAALTVNGIAVSSQTNSVTGAIEGVSLDLVKTGTGNLNVTSNTSTVKSSVDAFVKAYNDLNTTIKKLTSYNAESKQAGVLLGDSSVRDIEAELRKMLSSSVSGSNSALKTLRDVGISVSREGTMSVDSSKLSAAMSKNLADVGALFSSMGKTTDSLISFVSSGSGSTPGEYEVFVSKLATQGNVAGSRDLRPLAVGIDGSNQNLTVTVDGVTASVSLPPGSYTAAETAALVQSAINGASELSSKGIAVSVKLDASGFMNITSNKYGSESKISISGDSVGTLLGTATSSDGIDAAGTIGGIAAKGSGQFLTGAEGSLTAGLKLQITGGAENASRGLVTFSQGHAFHLDKLVEGFLGDKGLLSGRTNGIKESIKDVGKQNENLNKRLADIEARYRKQFTALDVAISRMTSTSAYLSQQLAQIANLSQQ